MYVKLWAECLKRRGHWGDLGIYRIVNMDLKEMERGQDSALSRCGPVPGTCEHGNQHSGSVKCRRFLDQLCDC
jgi:hypothetical protein